MDKNKRYITQLSGTDMREIADAANIHAADGIDIVRTPEGLEVSIDRAQLTRWVKTIINGGNI